MRNSRMKKMTMQLSMVAAARARWDCCCWWSSEVVESRKVRVESRTRNRENSAADNFLSEQVL